METLYNHPALKERRRRLRREQTYTERILWSQLRGRRLQGFKFFRQYSVGPFILDFYCPQQSLAIELDGPEHASPARRERDTRRTAYLNDIGITVIRFWNDELLENPNRVIDAILAALNAPRETT